MLAKFFSVIFTILGLLLSSGSSEPRRCPAGYILVPGSSAYHTADFCVMKYDAKCDNPNPACITKEGVYRDNAPGCSCTGAHHVVSTAPGAPLTYLPEVSSDAHNATTYCAAVGAHLINNDEWMTIAKNVASVPANWCNRDGTGCGNSPGAAGKILVNGHNDSRPSVALPAGEDTLPCFGTTPTNQCGSPSSQKRTHTLTNGEVIWDFAGNVWSWVDAVIARKSQPRSLVPGLGNFRWTWAEFQTVPPSPDYTPTDPAWSSKEGVGRIFHYNSVGDTDPTLYTFIRGGNWRHGYDSGVFTIHMQPVPEKTNIDDVGFRCVL